MSALSEISLLLSKPSPDPIYVSRQSSVATLFGGNAKAIGEIAFANRTGIAVRILYESAKDTEKPSLARRIVESVRDRNARLVGALVVELGLGTTLQTAPLRREGAGQLAQGLIDALSFRPNAPTDDDLTVLGAWAGSMISVIVKGRTSRNDVAVIRDLRPFQSLLEKVTDCKRDRLLNRILQQGNPVIDRDRRRLLDRLHSLAVPDDLLNLLHRADETAETDFNGGMEKLRTFLERTAEACCRRATGARADIPLPEKNAGGSLVPWKDYAVSVGLLTKTEGGVFQALYNFLSMEGSHAVSSQGEQFHVARSSVVEWCLLLSGRVGSTTS